MKIIFISITAYSKSQLIDLKKAISILNINRNVILS